MCSVFSQILLERYRLIRKAQKLPQDDVDVEDAINFLADYDYAPQILYCHVITTLDYIAEEASYKVSICPELRKIAKWLWKEVVLKINIDKKQTINVKTRIAVDMLNKLENKGIINKDLNLFYFDNVITNVQDLWWDVIPNLDHLPF